MSVYFDLSPRARDWRFRLRRLATDDPAGTPVASGVPARTPLRGQWPVWERITEIVAGAAGRARTALVIAGPEGSGKTRLLEELMVAARRAGHIVITDASLAGAGLGQAATIRRLPNATGSRLVIVLCDRPPTSLPRFETVEGAPLLCVATVCCEPAGPADDGDSVVVAVPRLSAAATRELVEDVVRASGLAVDLEETVALAAAAAGNPRAIVELVHGLAEERPLPLVLPRRSRARIVARLRTASPDARQAVAVAAKLGRPFSTAELSPVLGMSVVRSAWAVDEAVALGLLVAGSSGALTFPHEQVRTVVLSTLAPVLSTAMDSAFASPRSPDAAPRALAEPEGVAEVEDQGWERLSAQQQRIAEMVGEGFTNRVIARRLHLSPHTVNYHLREIFKKLGITSRVQLARRGRV